MQDANDKIALVERYRETKQAWDKEERQEPTAQNKDIYLDYWKACTALARELRDGRVLVYDGMAYLQSNYSPLGDGITVRGPVFGLGVKEK